jgi:hypothetical protein
VAIEQMPGGQGELSRLGAGLAKPLESGSLEVVGIQSPQIPHESYGTVRDEHGERCRDRTEPSIDPRAPKLQEPRCHDPGEECGCMRQPGSAHDAHGEGQLHGQSKPQPPTERPPLAGRRRPRSNGQDEESTDESEPDSGRSATDRGRREPGRDAGHRDHREAREHEEAKPAEPRFQQASDGIADHDRVVQEVSRVEVDEAGRDDPMRISSTNRES